MVKSKSNKNQLIIKVGRLSKKIADAINRASGDICITNATISHINERHSYELSQLGMDAIGFVRYAVGNFTQILEDPKNKSLLLACVPEGKTSKVVVITIAQRDGAYYVKTATPMITVYLSRKNLIWVK